MCIRDSGSSTIAVCIDVKKDFLGKEKVWIRAGTKSLTYNPVQYARQMEERGAGEIIIQSIERDGTKEGYDINLIKKVAESVTIPVVALGGSGKWQHIIELNSLVSLNGLAAGSLFIYHGCLLYTSYAAVEQGSVDLGGRRII